MTLKFIGSQYTPAYLALSTDVVDNKISGAAIVGKVIYLTDTQTNKIILDDLTLADYSQGGGGSGTVTPTGTITPNHIAVFDDVTGNVIKDGGAIPSTPPTQVDPTSIAGCVLWLDANTISGVSGDSIGTWTDLSVSGNDAVQSTGGNQPVLQESAFNGKKALMFDGANSWMQFNTNIDQSGSHTFIIVMATERGNTYGAAFSFKQYRLYSNLNGFTNWGFYRNADIYCGYPISGNAQIVGSWYNTSSDYYCIEGTSRFKIQTAGTDSADTVSYIGRDSAVGQYHKGFICEIAMWDNKISESNLLAYIKWLTYKWRGIIYG